jgi:hypothetical protein
MEKINKSLVNRLSIVAFVLLGFFVSCTSPAEKFIRNDFATTVRLDALEGEIEGEIANIVSTLNDMAEKANPDAMESKRLAQLYDQTVRDLERQMNRSGNNWVDALDMLARAEEAENNLAKSKRLKKKAQPYINHAKKQLDALVEALHGVDSEELLLSTTLVKKEEVSIDTIFKSIVGTPDAFANPTKEDIESAALIVLTNYFVDNPTPAVKAYEFNKKDDHWYVVLSNDAEYFVRAIKCSDGEYDYRYSEVESSFASVGRSMSNSKRGKRSANFDDFLDKYEAFVTEYVKKYKTLQKKVESGDMSAISDLAELTEKAEDFADEYEDWDGNITNQQANRYLKITQKLTSILE